MEASSSSRGTVFFGVKVRKEKLSIFLLMSFGPSPDLLTLQLLLKIKPNAKLHVQSVLWPKSVANLFCSLVARKRHWFYTVYKGFTRKSMLKQH